MTFIPSPNLLFTLRAADMTLTSDQQFTKVAGFTKYVPSSILAVRVTGGVATSCVGGIYPSASKAGTAIVAATQSWGNLTASNKIVNATLAAVAGTDAQTATPYLSLTSGSSAATTANLFIYGSVVD